MKKSTEWKLKNLTYDQLVEQAKATHGERGYVYLWMDTVHGIEDKAVIAKIQGDNTDMVKWHEVTIKHDGDMAYIKIHKHRINIDEFYAFDTMWM